MVNEWRGSPAAEATSLVFAGVRSTDSLRYEGHDSLIIYSSVLAMATGVICQNYRGDYWSWISHLHYVGGCSGGFPWIAGDELGGER